VYKIEKSLLSTELALQSWERNLSSISTAFLYSNNDLLYYVRTRSSITNIDKKLLDCSQGT